MTPEQVKYWIQLKHVVEGDEYFHDSISLVIKYYILPLTQLNERAQSYCLCGLLHRITT